MQPMTRPGHVHDLLDSCQRPGCPVCSIVARTRWRYLDSLAYENVNDPGVRARLRASYGFCNRHAWYFVERVREVFGAAIIYREILHALQYVTTYSRRRRRDMLEVSGSCPACVAEWTSTDYALLSLIEAIRDSDLRSALRASDGLCAPHFSQALVVAKPSVRRPFIADILACWDRRTDAPRIPWRAAGSAETFPTDNDAWTRTYEVTGHHTATAALVGPYTCPVCAVTRAELARFGSWTSLDDGERVLCNVHAWMVPAADCSDTFVRQLRLVGRRSEQLADAPRELWLWQAVRRLGLTLPPGEDANRFERLDLGCFVCQWLAKLEAEACHDLDGPLCLPHLRRAASIHGPTIIQRVRPTWRKLDRLLSEYLRKEDYRFRHEPRGEEQNAPRWAVALIAGAPGVR